MDRKIYKYIIPINTIKYENMAKIIATDQMGTTVLCLYPTPNGRYAPLS